MLSRAAGESQQHFPEEAPAIEFTNRTGRLYNDRNPILPDSRSLLLARPFSARSIFIACLVLVVLVLWALTVHSQSELQVGYATINADETSSLPVATALFSFRNAQGILVAEVGVEAVEPIRRGRIFVDQDGTRTGLALANSGDQSVTAALILRNAAGLEIDQSQLILEPREHIAVFVDELFPGALEDLTAV